METKRYDTPRNTMEGNRQEPCYRQKDNTELFQGEL